MYIYMHIYICIYIYTGNSMCVCVQFHLVVAIEHNRVVTVNVRHGGYERGREAEEGCSVQIDTCLQSHRHRSNCETDL